MATKIITVANQKGGVGKTTTVVNLGHGLARSGKSVLIIDLDPQGQVVTPLKMKPDRGAYHLLTRVGDTQPEIEIVRQRIRDSGRERWWILPGNELTNQAQMHINAMGKDISHVRWAVRPFMSDSLDYILFDTSPSVGGVQERALWAADLVIIPTSPDYMSLQGVRNTINVLSVLKRDKGWKGGLLGVLPTFYETHTLAAQAAIKDLKNGFGERGLLLTPIHRATILNQCGAAGQTIFERAPESRAAVEYQRLVNIVLKY
jgi:chromosome partitioning protein